MPHHLRRQPKSTQQCGLSHFCERSGLKFLFEFAPYLPPKLVHRAGCQLAASRQTKQAGIKKIVPFQHPYHLAEQNFLRRDIKGYTAIRSSVRDQQIGLCQALQYFGQKMKRYIELFRHLPDADVFLAAAFADHVQECPQAVFAGFGEYFQGGKLF
jgi:hypothetical protein